MWPTALAIRQTLDSVPDSAGELVEATGIPFGDAVRIVRSANSVRHGSARPAVVTPMSLHDSGEVAAKVPRTPMPDYPMPISDLIGYGIPDSDPVSLNRIRYP